MEVIKIKNKNEYLFFHGINTEKIELRIIDINDERRTAHIPIE